MDYYELAKEMLGKMQLLYRLKSQKDINETMRGEAFVLNFIEEQDSAVLPGEIGSEMCVSSARIATALNSLEKKGLITRQIDPNDRRKILVCITQKGKELAKRHKNGIINVVKSILEQLGEHDAKEYVRILDRIVNITPDFKNTDADIPV